MTDRQSILTRDAWVAILAGELPCDTCDGRGRIPRVGKHGTRACPACFGKGVPRTPRIAYPQPTERRVGA